MVTFHAAEKRTAFVFVLAFLILAAGIVTAGYLNYRSFEKRHRTEVERQLSAIADLKAYELARWRTERVGDASVFFRNSAFSALVRQCFENTEDVASWAQLRTWLSQTQAAYQCDRVCIHDAAGIERMSVPEGREPVASVFSQRASEVLRSGEVVFEDFYRNEHDQRILITILVPILNVQAGGPIGILAFRIDPAQYLYPLIHRWPTPSRTAGTLLLRREGNEAVVLNDLESRKNTALNLRIPLEKNSELPAVKAVLGRRGIVEGRDYRGIPTLADVRPVPGSPWFLVTRLDLSEVYLPVRARLWWMLVIVCALLFAAVSAVWLVWRRQAVRLYRQRYEAAEDLRKSEERYRDLVENVQDLICTHDMEGNLLSVNEAAVKFTGHPREALLDMNLRDLLAPEVRDLFGAYLGEIEAKGRTTGIMKIRHAQGETRYWEYNTSLKRAEYPDIPIVRGISHDITERLRAEKALRESESKYRTLFETSNDGILVGAEVFTECNEQACRIFGCSREDIIGHPPWEFSPPTQPDGRDSKEEALERLEKALSGEPQSFYWQHRRKDGRPVDCEVSLQAVTIAGKQIVQATLRDVTERRQMVEALRKNEERLRLALAAADQGLYDLNVQTGKAIVSPEYARMLGYEPDELEETNAKWRERLHPDDRDPVSRAYEEYIAGMRDEYRVEFRQKTRSGDWKWILSLGRVLKRDEQGRPLRMLGTHTDITDRKQAEEDRRQMEAEFRQAHKMEAVGLLAGGVAHDFNNMLNVIIGYADMGLSRVDSRDPLHGYLLEIRNAGQHSADLTRKLLAFSRRQTAEPRVINLNEVITSQQNLLSRMIGEDIGIDFLPARDLWNIRVDPSQIEQILANFAANARDSMTGVGTIAIETANVVLDETYCRGHVDATPGEYVMFAFSDTGEGIDADTLPRIFEPFFTTKEKGKGTGLGLSTVYGIVKQNKGIVQAHSEPGAGTTFKIYLPRCLSEPDAPAEEGVRSVEGTETVLIVEDEKQVLALARTILERHGYEVLAARTPEEACALVGKHEREIHLLFTDVVMPGMNGKELQERIEGLKPGIKTLFMSGYTADVIAQRGVLEEGVEFIQKPFSVASLVQKVRQVLDS